MYFFVTLLSCSDNSSIIEEGLTTTTDLDVFFVVSFSLRIFLLNFFFVSFLSEDELEEVDISFGFSAQMLLQCGDKLLLYLPNFQGMKDTGNLSVGSILEQNLSLTIDEPIGIFTAASWNVKKGLVTLQVKKDVDAKTEINVTVLVFDPLRSIVFCGIRVTFV